MSAGTGTSAGGADWLGDLIHELRDPRTITHAAVLDLARTDPAEYARLVVGLAVDGTAVTREGDTLVRDDHVREHWETLPEDHRPSYGAALLIEALTALTIQ